MSTNFAVISRNYCDVYSSQFKLIRQFKSLMDLLLNVSYTNALFKRVKLFILWDCSTGLKDNYKRYFHIPYFIFIRDTLSYLALVGLHFAICLEPSQLPFSGLEWTILVFLFGRLLVEIKQIADMARSGDRKLRLKALRNYFR